MTIALGCLLGVGVLLVVSPFLWPARDGRQRSKLSGMLHERLIQAGLRRVSLPMVVALSVLIAIVAGAVTFAIVAVAALAIVAGIVAFFLPAVLINWRAAAHRRANRAVWPDVVDHLISAVRSGLALPDSVAALAHTGPVSTRESFAEFERDYRLTGNFVFSIGQLKSQLADPVADRILETLRMSREVGGSELTAVLRNLASYLRSEAALRAEVEARQSWVKNAAKLGVGAPWVILLLLASRPEAAAAYNTSAGVALIVAGLGVTVAAYRVMLAMGRMPEERRWFQ